MRKLLLIVCALAGFVSSGFAGDYRAFFLVRDSHGVHGPPIITAEGKRVFKTYDGGEPHPYEWSISGPSASWVRSEILREYPKAVQIEIHQQP